MNLPPLFFSALFLTIIVEFFVLAAVLRERYGTIAITVVLINAVTNPAMNICHLLLDVPVFQLELLVLCIETILIHMLLRLSWPRALCCSILANGISFIVGLVIRI